MHSVMAFPRRRTRRLIALLLILGLGITAFVFYRYMTTKQPLTQIVPGVSAISQPPPRFVGAIYGATEPLGVAVTPSGDRVYVTEGDGDRMVKEFDRAGKQITAFAPPDTTEGGRKPAYIALKSDGSVYVSDLLRHDISIYSADGQFQQTFQPADIAAGEWAPLALTFDKDGNLYVANAAPGKQGVIVFDPQGQVKLRFGEEGDQPGQFSFPNGIAVDDKGQIFVSDSNNGRVQEFDAQGKLIGVIGRGSGKGDLSLPRGLAIGSDGRLFVADVTREEVLVYDATGKPSFLHSFGDEGKMDGEFLFPNGLTLDSSGQIYVTDRGNGRVQLWHY